MLLHFLIKILAKEATVIALDCGFLLQSCLTVSTTCSYDINVMLFG